MSAIDARRRPYNPELLGEYLDMEISTHWRLMQRARRRRDTADSPLDRHLFAREATEWRSVLNSLRVLRRAALGIGAYRSGLWFGGLELESFGAAKSEVRA